jgi:hypothetical protein
MVLFVVPITFAQIFISLALVASLVTEGFNMLVIGFIPLISLLSLWRLFFKRNECKIKDISNYHRFSLTVGLIISVYFTIAGLLGFSFNPLAIFVSLLSSLFSSSGAIIALGTILVYIRDNEKSEIQNVMQEHT